MSNKGRKIQGWRQGQQKTAGIKQKVDAFIDVRRAADKYLRDRGLIKLMKEHMDQYFERKEK